MSNTSTGASADAGAVGKKVEVTVPASAVVPQVAETVKLVENVVVKVEDAAVSKVEDVDDDMHDLSHFKLTEAEIRDVVADVIAKRYRKANAEEREKIRKDYDTDIDGNIHHAVMDKIIAKEKVRRNIPQQKLSMRHSETSYLIFFDYAAVLHSYIILLIARMRL